MPKLSVKPKLRGRILDIYRSVIWPVYGTLIYSTPILWSPSPWSCYWFSISTFWSKLLGPCSVPLLSSCAKFVSDFKGLVQWGAHFGRRARSASSEGPKCFNGLGREPHRNSRWHMHSFDPFHLSNHPHFWLGLGHIYRQELTNAAAYWPIAWQNRLLSIAKYDRLAFYTAWSCIHQLYRSALTYRFSHPATLKFCLIWLNWLSLTKFHLVWIVSSSHFTNCPIPDQPHGAG